jgi:hypothetical protein
MLVRVSIEMELSLDGNIQAWNSVQIFLIHPVIQVPHKKK